MARHSSAMFGWSWTAVSVLDSQVLGKALMESCDRQQQEQREVPRQCYEQKMQY